MTFNDYQNEAVKTAVYPDHLEILYPALGLAGECGEVCEKVKKVFRDKEGVVSEETKTELAKELGDVLWYIANLATDLELTMDVIAETNITKLKSRRERGVIHGNGDNK